MFGLSRRKAATSRRGGGFLSRLARDSRGNTLAIVGAALIPLAAMIGSGVDMSRAYMAKTRLQTACDAAALAGRRVMQNDTLDSSVTTEATRFFNYNFNQGQYGTAAFTPTVTRPESGKIRVSANTTIPTTVMRMFGFTTLPLSVTCDAQLSFVNTDVMLVLDVTGSMDSTINGTKKIVSLRDAVMALYDTLEPIQTQLQANGMRLRYGVVPYSTTVNVGALIRAVNPDYLVDTLHDYNTRLANFDHQVAEYSSTPQPPSAPVTQVYNDSISQSECDRYGRNVSFSGFWPSATTGGGPPPTATWSRTFSNNESTGVDWGWSGASDTSGTNRSCRRRYVETDTTYVVSGYHYERSGYSYSPEDLDVSQYKLGNAVSYATSIPRYDDTTPAQAPNGGDWDMMEAAANATGVSTASVTWNGCIQERKTVSTITASSGYVIPADAYDLNINLIPYDDDTRWRPMFPQLYYRSDSHNNVGLSGAPCPAATRGLQAWTRTDLLNYVNALTPTGNTYHDIGMIWGARLLSNQGIFAADNPDTFNGMPVSRHIIFMTDGDMDTDNDVLAFQGLEANDQKVGGNPTPSDNDTALNSTTSMEARHVQRMRMVCNAAKAMGYSIWVIAFGTALQPHLAECASNANQASTAADRDQLIARFQQIGANIGALRLTQ
jgi:Flp pilus assembly protein TadG